MRNTQPSKILKFFKRYTLKFVNDLRLCFEEVPNFILKIFLFWISSKLCSLNSKGIIPPSGENSWPYLSPVEGLSSRQMVKQFHTTEYFIHPFLCTSKDTHWVLTTRISVYLDEENRRKRQSLLWKLLKSAVIMNNPHQAPLKNVVWIKVK